MLSGIGADLAASYVSAPVSAAPGGTINVSIGVSNYGNAASGGYYVGVYASSDRFINTQDILLKAVWRPNVSPYSSQGWTESVNLPSWLSGSYSIGIVCDPWGYVNETNEWNNTLAAYSSTNIAATVSTTSYLYSSQSTANAGQWVSFTDYVYPNSGSAAPTGSIAVYDNGNYVATANLVNTGYGYSYATWGTSSLSVGSHTMRFAYNGNFQTSSASVSELIQATTVSTTSYLYSSQSTANAGQWVSFTDYVYPNSGSAAPTGSVAIYDNGNYVATANLVNTGYGYSYSTWGTSSLSVGSHTIRFAYNGNGSFQTSSASVSELIQATAVSTSSQLYSSQSTANAGQWVSFTGYVFPNSGSAAPTGSVNVYDNGNYVATANLINTGYGYSYATWGTSSLSVGSHTIRFAYNGNGSFQTSSASVSELIQATTVSKAAQLGKMLLGSAYAGVSLGYLDYYTSGPNENGGYGGYHPGIDYYAPMDTTVYSPVKGVVANVEPIYGQLAIQIAGTNDYFLFIHLDLSKFHLAKGQMVNVGDMIGSSGKTSPNPVGPHLHVELRTGRIIGAYYFMSLSNTGVNKNPTSILG
jgi:murein DD-endopeptidase MepM/ murein hydrolase activator NlpD